MKFMHILGAAALASVVAQPLLSEGHALGEADAAIKYRQAVMSAVGGHTGGLVAILKGDIDNTEALATHLRAMEASTNPALVLRAFSQNTDGEGSEETTATAKIWEDWDGFEAEVLKLNTATADLLALAEAGDLKSFDQLGSMLGTCGACHRELGYRKR